MSVLVDVIKEEESRLLYLLQMYNQKLCDYPRGSLSLKRRGSGEYCYLAHREKDKVKFVYIGKKESSKVKEYEQKIDERKRIKNKIAKVKLNLKEVEGLLHAVK